MFCPTTSQGVSNRGNHLSAKNCPLGPFISVQEAPLPSFGLLARGVYRVPPTEFPPVASSLWHFQGYSSIAETLACFSCRYINMYLGLFFRQARTLQTSQSVRAWTFLSLNTQAAITRKSQNVFLIKIDAFFHCHHYHLPENSFG